MKRVKTVALFLSLAMVFIPMVTGTQAQAADEQEKDNGMVISKMAQANMDGSYTITLEAYATGSKITTETKKDVPTDVILVLDQSGSMSEDMFSYSFQEYTNRDNDDYYGLRHNGARNSNLYFPLEDGGYATVSVIRARPYIYTKCPDNWNNDAQGSWPNYSPDDYWKYADSLFVKTGEEYQRVELTRSRDRQGYTYTYTFPDGSTVVCQGSDQSPDFGDKGPLYYRTESNRGEYTYTYTYTDENGITQTIGISTGANTQPEFTLYQRYASSSTSRLEALQTAVANFTNSVRAKAAGEDGIIGTADDVNHRVAVVGFATGNRGQSGYPAYENTEVFVGSQQYNYNSNASGYYDDALQNMDTDAGYNNVIASKNALDAHGATYPNYGLEMAKGIFDANPLQETEKRNRVVILFTDGTPGYSSYESDVASAAVDEADTLKNMGVTVYSVGIFEGADATSAGIAQGAGNRQANQFMQDVSSNNGTPRTPSYYLSASDADTLNSIFQQISDQIEEGGSSTTLDGETVIKDIISPSFTLPEGADASEIMLETYAYGQDGKWTKNNSAMGAAATVSGDRVDVTGFDFAANWCGTETAANGDVNYRGNKLVISFTVEPKAGFLGGNGVPTNSSAGIYENDGADEPVFIFPEPKVDVEIGSITVTAPDKDVYLLQNIPAADLQNGTASVGDVVLDLSRADENYGLEAWQTAYVEITAEVMDKDGNAVANGFTGLTEDSEYTVSLKVSPKTEGDAMEQTGSGKGNILVYKPELTYQDSEAWYGADVPTDFIENLTYTKWVHGETEADINKMGSAPELTFVYTPDETKVKDAKINTKQDVPVDAAVRIGNTDVTMHTAFQHINCTGQSCEVPGNYEFLLHINTCRLTVTKTGGAEGEPYVFTVKKDGRKYSEITIVGNRSETIAELPVGTYTVTEDQGWSWRYDSDNGTGFVLTAEHPSGSITCANTKINNNWLNGFSNVVKNIFSTEN